MELDQTQVDLLYLSEVVLVEVLIAVLTFVSTYYCRSDRQRVLSLVGGLASMLSVAIFALLTLV